MSKFVSVSEPVEKKFNAAGRTFLEESNIIP
jgi:hypothetical protein